MFQDSASPIFAADSNGITATFAPSAVADPQVGEQRDPNVHIRVQQRTGRKSITTVSGLNPELDFKLLLKELKRKFSCNGSIQHDRDHGA